MILISSCLRWMFAPLHKSIPCTWTSNTVAYGVEKLGYRKPRSFVPYSLQVFAKMTPKASPGSRIGKILGLAGERVIPYWGHSIQKQKFEFEAPAKPLHS